MSLSDWSLMANETKKKIGFLHQSTKIAMQWHQKDNINRNIKKKCIESSRHHIEAHNHVNSVHIYLHSHKQMDSIITKRYFFRPSFSHSFGAFHSHHHVWYVWVLLLPLLEFKQCWSCASAVAFVIFVVFASVEFLRYFTSFYVFLVHWYFAVAWSLAGKLILNIMLGCCCISTVCFIEWAHFSSSLSRSSSEINNREFHQNIYGGDRNRHTIKSKDPEIAHQLAVQLTKDIYKH